MKLFVKGEGDGNGKFPIGFKFSDKSRVGMLLRGAPEAISSKPGLHETIKAN